MGNSATSPRRWLPIIVGAAMVLPAITGCGSGHPTSTATPVKPANAWDPCTGINDQTLRNAGLDPATKDTNVEGPPGWKFCGWKPIGYTAVGPTSYTVSLMSTTTESIDGIRQDSFNKHIVDVTVSGRKGLQYNLSGDDPKIDCEIAFGTSIGGAVSVSVDRVPINPYPESVCDSTKHTAARLLPGLPE